RLMMTIFWRDAKVYRSFCSAVICERLKNVIAVIRTKIIMLPSPAKIKPLPVSIVVLISIVKQLSMSRMRFDSSPSPQLLGTEQS
ncbi:MAG: hypothetical protein ACI9E4_000958, partial [Pseudohongiellaceae bacterium]